MPPTTSFALCHTERPGGRYRRAQRLFNLLRAVFLSGRQRAIGCGARRREPASARQARTFDALL